MIKIQNTILGKVPRVVLAVGDRETNRAIQPLGADLLELRVDRFTRLEEDYVERNVAARRKLGLPLILTIRPREEGGQCAITPEQRLRLFARNIPRVDMVDVELKSPILSRVVAMAKAQRKPVIVSFHDFKTTPTDRALTAILTAAKKSGATLVKIAAYARCSADVSRLMRFTRRHRAKNLVTIAMGPLGSVSRVAFFAVGSLLTYTHLKHSTAPGQMPIGVLQKELRGCYPRYRPHHEH